MDWLKSLLFQLASRPACGYLEHQAAAAEPTALAVLALAGHGQHAAAQAGADFLRNLQRPDGSVPIRGGDEGPGWPSSLAVLAWRALGDAPGAAHVARALDWIEAQHGKKLERNPEMGHNTQLDGWPWAEGTHSWLEPSALHLLALKAVQRKRGQRAREAVELLIDRQLPDGGCNYGNTVVLGQVLRPHVQPTGMALAALAGERDASGRVAQSVRWLRSAIGPETTAASLSWAVLGLAAQGVTVPDAEHWLGLALARVEARERSPLRRALIALAALGSQAPLGPARTANS